MLTSEELQTVLSHVSDGMGLSQAIGQVGKQLDDQMRDWFIPDPQSSRLTQPHLAYLVVKAEAKKP